VRWLPLAVAPMAWPTAALLGCAHPGSGPSARELSGDVQGPEPARPGEVQVGYATWYGARFAGRLTASGEPFDPSRMTAAHRSLPFGTWVDVERVDTGESVRVRITDRGPFGHEERIIDLSRAAAKKLGMLHAGMLRVRVRVVGWP
jgi:rare lipoprotein A